MYSGIYELVETKPGKGFVKKKKRHKLVDQLLDD